MNEPQPKATPPKIGEYYRKLYAKARKQFDPEETRKLYESEEPMVPFEQVLAEIDQISDEDDPTENSL